MAVAEQSPPQGLDAVSPEDLARELEQREDEELQEMGRRLESSTMNLQSLLDDLQKEQVALQEDNKELRGTIELMMRELKKLNIGKLNTTEPKLAGGDSPLNAVGRWWEKVRPRDTAVQVDEHTGELRKQGEGTPKQAVAREELNQLLADFDKLNDQIDLRAQELRQKAEEAQRKAQQKAQEVSQRARVASEEALSKLQTSVGSLWQKGGGLWGSLGAAAPGAEKPQKKKKAKPAATGDETPTRSEQSADAEETLPSSQPEQDQEQLVPAAAPQPEPGQAAITELPVPERIQEVAAADDLPVEPSSSAPAADAPISSTIMIKARLRLDDGSVHSLQVAAADRAKEVSRRFVQEHSLKAWFQEPLTKWLKQVEEDAEDLPVEVEGDLEEIRKQYSKKAPA